jgi:hypothetical protein
MNTKEKGTERKGCCRPDWYSAEQNDVRLRDKVSYSSVKHTTTTAAAYAMASIYHTWPRHVPGLT